MQEKSKIIEGAAKTGAKVPEKYFEKLNERLYAIPDLRRRANSPVSRLKPYLALAASFTAILLIGNTVLRNTTADRVQNDIYNEFSRVSLLQADEYLRTGSDFQDTISNEDVINYLIDSGVSTELIEYTGLMAKK